MVIPAIEMLMRMGAGTFLGAAVGYERERSGHPAGLRTHLLVGLASTTFMLVSNQFIYFQHYRKEDLIAVDTSRIAASVVTGIGFVGAGAIIRNGMNVQGLTTAASLWLVAAIGLAAGGGMYTVAFVATLLALFCLTILRQIEGIRWHICQRQIEIVSKKSILNRNDILTELNTLGHVVKDLECDDDFTKDELRLTFELRLANEHAVEPLLARLESLPGIVSIKLLRAA